MAWADIALVVLRLAVGFIDWARGQQQFNAGQDYALAQIAAEVLKKSVFAKNVMEQINGVRGEDLDKLLKSLEPDGVPGPGTPPPDKLGNG